VPKGHESEDVHLPFTPCGSEWSDKIKDHGLGDARPALFAGYALKCFRGRVFDRPCGTFEAA
jgi:hypothetical protein